MNEALKSDDITQRSTPAQDDVTHRASPAPVETAPRRRRRPLLTFAVIAALAAAAAFAWLKLPHTVPSINRLILLRTFGAGDGIRTHDPNLGKVVLYP
jgi:hypothetical protein